MKNQAVTLRCSAKIFLKIWQTFSVGVSFFDETGRLNDCNFIEEGLRRFLLNNSKFPRTFLLEKTTGLLPLEMTQESLYYFGENFRNASFLTRHRLYFNSSYIFAKSSTKAHCFTQSDCYFAGFNILLKEYLAGHEKDDYIHTECLTVCFLVPWQENINMKMLNILLATFFNFLHCSYFPFQTQLFLGFP